MILTREQIDAHIALRESMDDPFVNGQFRFDPSRLWALINGTNDLIATARAYHDLRDAVLGWCDEPSVVRGDDGYASIVWPDKDDLRAVVARVERDNNA